MATVPEGERESLLERSYVWMHRHFPHIVDCRPIDAAGFVESAGLAVQQEERTTIWTMPVSILIARKPVETLK
jgi:demethylmenaquinone methyltransferase/2-methoxy-6-polyprenyl-1,4-benzoquinol methylase